jgi:hypothetical protein
MMALHLKTNRRLATYHHGRHHHHHRHGGQPQKPNDKAIEALKPRRSGGDRTGQRLNYPAMRHVSCADVDIDRLFQGF